jgi:hypothetical protein
MARDKKKDFNKFIDNYIERVQHRRPDNEPAREIKLKKKDAPDNTMALEEKELEIANTPKKPGFFSRLFGSGQPKDDVEPAEGPAMDSHVPQQPKVIHMQYERPSAVERYRGDGGEDIRFLIRTMDTLMSRMNAKDRQRFVDSREYQLYQGVRRKYR